MEDDLLYELVESSKTRDKTKAELDMDELYLPNYPNLSPYSFYLLPLLTELSDTKPVSIQSAYLLNTASL